MSKPVILTGLRANNDLHIGNYLGAVLPMVDMSHQKADEYQINLFVPDLHSFTTPIDHSKLYGQIIETVRFYLAAGFNVAHENVHIYRQSFIPAHSELTVILSNFASMGILSRMTQFKEKAKFSNEQFTENVLDYHSFSIEVEKLLGIDALTDEKYQKFEKLFSKYFEGYIEHQRLMKAAGNLGLFSYPVLMAADILLHNATYVPVGDDQTQHLEFTRDIAERMNNKFGELFTVPKPVKEQHAFFGKDQGLRIRDLSDPTKKMSKSDETGKGVIFLADSPEIARKKIMSATTDSLENVQYDYDNQPGISNLLDLLKLFGGETEEFLGQNQYGPLKTAVADRVSAFLADFQSKLADVSEEAAVKQLENGEQTVKVQAEMTLLRVQKAVGLRK